VESVAIMENLATMESAAAMESVAAIPEQQEEEPPPLSKKLAPLDRVLFQPSTEVRIAPVKPVPTTVAARVPSPEIPLHVAPARSVVTLSAGKPVPGEQIHLQAASVEDHFTTYETAEPLPSRRRSVAFMRTRLPLAESAGMGTAALEPLPHLLPHLGIPPIGQVSAPSVYQPGAPLSVSSGLTLGESLSALLYGLQREAEEADRRGVQAIASSFAARPRTPLLTAPAEIVEAPAPPSEEWLGTAKPKFTAAEPESAGRAALIGPRAPTLAGPTLPPQLLNLGQKPSGIKPRRKRFVTWPFVLLGTLVLTIVGLQYYTQDRGRTVSAMLPAPISQVFSAPSSHAADEHPAARSVEVAGIRVLTPPRRKPQVQFLVINHSSNEITGLNIHLMVSSADAASDAPLFTVSSIVSSLGPDQSREIRVDVNAPIQSSDVPDWQHLRTQVLIGRE
jgi:hypothetical protein